MKAAIERRRFRRADLDVEVLIRPVKQPQEDRSVIHGQVKNISLAGLLCFVNAPCSLTPGESVTCCITIPPDQSRWFPFTRLAGKGTVIRLDPVAQGRRAGEQPDGEPFLGLAVAFCPDVTALGSIEMMY